MTQGPSNLHPARHKLTGCHFLVGMAILISLLVTGNPAAMADESDVIPASATLEIGATEQAFAIIQRVYQADDADPVAQHRLLFDAGVIYDLPEIQTRIVTVYDPAKKQVTLLDRVAKNQTIISAEKLVEFTANVKASTAHPGDLGIGTAATPSDRVDGYTAEFSTTTDGKRFGARYDVTTQSVGSRKMADDFGRFSDLSSRLSLLRHRGMPPFARMSISRKLASLGVLPDETRLTVQHGDRTDRFRSKTQIEAFAGKDVETIKEVQGMMASYDSVAMNAFTTE